MHSWNVKLTYNETLENGVEREGSGKFDAVVGKERGHVVLNQRPDGAVVLGCALITMHFAPNILRPSQQPCLHCCIRTIQRLHSLHGEPKTRKHQLGQRNIASDEVVS